MNNDARHCTLPNKRQNCFEKFKSCKVHFLQRTKYRVLYHGDKIFWCKGR